MYLSCHGPDLGVLVPVLLIPVPCPGLEGFVEPDPDTGLLPLLAPLWMSR